MSETTHTWGPTVFKSAPALKCSECGFIWQPHMRKPKVTCEQIKERNKLPYKPKPKVKPVAKKANPVEDTVNALIAKYGTPGAALEEHARVNYEASVLNFDPEVLPSDMDADDPKIVADFAVAEDLRSLLNMNSSRLG